MEVEEIDSPLPAVHFRGIVLGPSGFAAEGREWLAALEDAGLAPSLEGARLGDLDQRLSTGEQALIERCAQRLPRPDVVFHHMLVPHFDPELGECNVLSTVWETEGLPSGWAENINRADVVLVKTEWNRRAFADAGVSPDKLQVLAPPVDPGAFDPARRRGDTTPGRRFRWLSVFDWSLRKGYDVLLRAFAQAFAEDQAELVLKIVPRADQSLDAVRAYCEAELRRHAPGQPPRVLIVEDLVDTEALADLYASADAFVLPSRGEGWGRPVHEALLMELPVVTTHATALATLVPDEQTGFPVAAQACPVSDEAARETPWFDGLVWYEPELDSLIGRMREVFEKPDDARARGRAGRRHLLRLCDRSRIASALRGVVAGALQRC